jgi:hypothetical protein
MPTAVFDHRPVTFQPPGSLHESTTMSEKDQSVENMPPADLEVAGDVEKDITDVEVTEDHSAVIDKVVEKRIRRKFDLWILPLLVVMQLCS